MATTNERVSVLETKVDNLKDSVEDLKLDIRDSNKEIKDQLKTMYDASCSQHAQLAQDLEELKGFKTKWLTGIALVGPVIAFIAAHIDWHALLNNAIK